MLMIMRTSVLLIMFVTLISLCFAFSPGDTVVSDAEIELENIKNAIPLGTSFERVKKYLDDKGIKYGSEKKEDLSLLHEPDLEANFAFQLVFAIDDEISGSGLSSIEKYIVVIIRFDKDSLVNDFFIEDAYKGL